MSFLNSVLNSIGSKNSPSPSLVPPVTPARPSPPRTEDGQSKAPQSKKRAAEDVIGQTRVKNPKTDHDALSTGGTTSIRTPIANDNTSAVSKPKPVVANGGQGGAKLKSKLSSTSIAPPAAPPKTNDVPPIKKEPKKGSYAEIMARAQANQAKAVAVGTISHKAKEKGALTYKKELKLRKRVEKDRRLGVVRKNDNSRPGSSDEAPKVGKAGSKGVKPRPNFQAKKPKPQPTYRGTMNPASETLKAKEKAAAQTRRRDNQYAATDDELDDEDEVEEDDDDGFDDEESDDMEAGFLDVEEEENAAAIAAKKEDEEEARLEAKLKREKEERKKKMEALAKKAKPQRY